MSGFSFGDVIDALMSQIAVISRDGQILYVNKAWKRFSQANGANGADAYVGRNYLDACKEAAQSGDAHAMEARDCLLLVMSREAMHRVLIYPCHSHTEKRWFELRLDRSCDGDGEEIVVASHLDVTAKVLAEKAETRIKSELAMANLELDRALKREWQIANTDILTGIGNRRLFLIWPSVRWPRQNATKRQSPSCCSTSISSRKSMTHSDISKAMTTCGRSRLQPVESSGRSTSWPVMAEMSSPRFCREPGPRPRWRSVDVW